VSNPFERQTAVPGIKKIILVGSGKGGVGKSTIAANLALAMKETGKRVGLLDADIYGPSIPRMFGALHQRPVFDPGADGKSRMQPLVRHGLMLMSMGFIVDEGQAVVWRGPMLFKAIEQFLRDVNWGELDILIVDLPPGTGDIALTMAQKVPVAGAIVVSTPQNLALIDAMKAIDMFKQVQVPLLGVIENMSYFQAPGTTEKVQLFPRGDLDSYLDTQKIEKLGVVAFEPRIGMSSEAGMPLVAAEPGSDIANIFMVMAEKITAKLQG
jgi:ATP-binding protein involved in chromosome partitioning